MNSKWEINRIGLIDFWYYDDEEFYFLDGRMLLRGSNGSGKSVTMQSFIPLLLDGNFRPERLDPFGSRARKLENYLLEEGDTRNERTGYLYMELKRSDSNTYQTVGMGIRARKSKPVDPWYFSLENGQRVNRDFFLYRTGKDKIALTKKELRNRIGEGGVVLDSQKEYMALVNRLFFGYESLDEYKETIDLLIQLRTPKLSKDLKPSVINEILSNSLPPLSEEDLRPMSDAIENMDTLKANLDQIKNAYQAANVIDRIYQRYNLYQVLKKSELYKDAYDLAKQSEKNIANLKEQLLQEKVQLTDANQTNDALTLEAEVIKSEINSLRDHDATKLKEEELTLKQQIKKNTSDIDKKEIAINIQKDSLNDLIRRKEQMEEFLEQQKTEIYQTLDEMEEYISQIPFDEFTYMKKDIISNLHKIYDFKLHHNLLQPFIDHINQGIRLLEQIQNYKQQHSQQASFVEEIKQKRDKLEREYQQYLEQYDEIQFELIEKVNRFNDSNQELIIDDSSLQLITNEIRHYDEHQDYSNIKEYVRKIKNNQETLIQNDLFIQTQQKHLLQSDITKLQQELKELENLEFKGPELDPKVTENRILLQKSGIEFFELYKMLDFKENLNDTQKDQIEEALYSMGLLHAIVVSKHDKDKVLKLDEGTKDTYIFTDVVPNQNNIRGLLNIDQEQNNIFVNSTINQVLEAIGFIQSNQNKTTLFDDGHYQIGIIEGTISKQYRSKYIGVSARIRYKQEQIEILEAKIAEVETQLAKQQSLIDQLNQRLETLENEFNQFPHGDDLILAFKELGKKEREVDSTYQHLNVQQETLKKLHQKSINLQQTLNQLVGYLHLPQQIDAFQQIEKDIKTYVKLVNDLQLSQVQYINHLERLETNKQSIEEKEGLIDDLLSQLRDLNYQMLGFNKALESTIQQLSLTNYQEIEERLNYCLQREKDIPMEAKKCSIEIGQLENSIDNKETQYQHGIIELETKKNRLVYFDQALYNELKLGYVEDIDFELKPYQLVNQLIKRITPQLTREDKEKYSTDLASTFATQNQQLVEYNLSLNDDLFSKDQYEGIYFSRYVIYGRYKGKQVNFKELLTYLQQDIETQSRLLNDQDREIFEDILANTIGKKIRARISSSQQWIKEMNQLMETMSTSESGLLLNLRWRSKKAEHEGQMDTHKLFQLLSKDTKLMKDDEFEALSSHFRSKINEARNRLDVQGKVQSFHQLMRETLDYRQWFEFQLEFKKGNNPKQSLTDNRFFRFSGGEKAMSMYIPLFSAVVAKYNGARSDAPRLIALDEAFAGVDEKNISDMFSLMVECDFSFIINSQILWGDYPTLPKLAIYQLIRPDDAKFVGVVSYVWNGEKRKAVDRIEETM